MKKQNEKPPHILDNPNVPKAATAAKEKPPIKIPKAMNVKQLRARKYKEVDLGEYSELLGDIEGKCLMFAYGPPAGGKSTWVLKLVNYLSEKYGKTLYDSHEEGINKTLQSRVIENNIDGPKLYFIAGLSHEQRMAFIRRRKPRVVVIDSVQMARLTYAQLIEMREMFRKRNIIFILVSFGKGLYQCAGAESLHHSADIKLHFRSGMLTAQSRYTGKQIKVRLFKPEFTEADEPEIPAEALKYSADAENGVAKN